jgi:hypothetical protein
MKSIVTFAIVGCVAWNVVITLLVYGALQRRKIPVNFLWLRVTILKYLDQYRDVTRQESGRTGTLFYQWLVSINLVWILFLVLAGLYWL